MVFSTVALGAALSSLGLGVSEAPTKPVLPRETGVPLSLASPIGSLKYIGRSLEFVAPQTQNAFNPDIAFVFNFQSRVLDTMVPPMRRSAMKEIELGITADVDPYMRTEAYIAIGSSIDGEEGEVEAEEAFGIFTGFGSGLDVKVGKFAGAVGRIGRNHLDQLDFLTYPLVVTEVMGGEAFRAPGISFSYLFPGGHFNELTLEAIAPQEEGPLFGEFDAGSPALIGHYRTFFDFTKDFSGQLGASYMTAKQAGETGRVYGVDFVGKLRPEGTGRSLILESEAYWFEAATPGSSNRVGYFASAAYQLTPRLWLGFKYDNCELPDGSDTLRAYTAGLTYRFTDFNHFRAELQRLLSASGPDRTQLVLQFQWVIGPHKPHKY